MLIYDPLYLRRFFFWPAPFDCQYFRFSKARYTFFTLEIGTRFHIISSPSSHLLFECKSVWPDGYNIFQYLAIYNIEKLPQSITDSSKYVSIFCLINPMKIAIFAKVAKFRQIWSHWCRCCTRSGKVLTSPSRELMPQGTAYQCSKVELSVIQAPQLPTKITNHFPSRFWIRDQVTVGKYLAWKDCRPAFLF